MGNTILHWHCFMNSLFMVKIHFRLGSDFFLKDNDGLFPIERSAENNAVRVIHFLNSYTKYPFMTNYFLFNDPTP